MRVTTKLMAASRRNVRDRGKSDSIDAIAVARAALREGLDALPAAQLDGPELDLRLLVDHRERLIRQRVALNNTLQWHLHDLWPELELPGSSLFYGRWASARRASSRARRADDARPHRPRLAAPHPRALPDDQGARSARSPRSSPRSRRSCSPSPASDPSTAAKLVGEVAGAARFSSDAKLARAAGVAPIPVSSGKTNRHRLDRGGNRQINATHSSRRRHPPALPPRNPGLHRPQTLRRQEHQRSHPLPQTPPHPPRLAPPPAAPPRPRNTAITINFLT